MDDHVEARRRARVGAGTRPTARLDPAERVEWAARFGVAPEQIDHDHLISHLLVAISAAVDRIIFYGGTALSRTVLADLRLSEDIDLLSVGSRRRVAGDLDLAVRDYMEPRFGQVTAAPWLAAVARDTQACLFQVGGIDVQVQLIEGTYYADWPTFEADIRQRYSGVPPVRMRTYTPRSFVGTKTSAWAETTRNAPRDLYDLWALAEQGWIDADAARLFKEHGPTGGYPERLLLPTKPPSEDQWLAALRHQCIPKVSAAEAHETVTRAWAVAVAGATGGG